MRQLNMETVPCLVLDIDAEKGATLAIIENLLREDLCFFEEAAAIRALIDCHAMTREEISRRLSLSPSAVSNKLRIMRLSTEERLIIKEANLTERHARALLRIENDEQRLAVLREIVRLGLNVTDAEEHISSLLHPAVIEPQQNVPRGTFLETDTQNVPRGTFNPKRYISSLNRTVDNLCKRGAEASSLVEENGEHYRIVITIQKKRS